jgi:hypothetical protein
MGSMAILEEEVLVSLASPNMKHFENLGYILPKIKSKKGTFVVPHGTEMIVKVKDLPESSRAKLTKICDDCGEHIIPKQYYYIIIKQRKKNDGKDRCRRCGNIYARKLWKENVPYECSLEYYATSNNKEYLIEEFSEKNEINSRMIYKSTNDLFLWNCLKCKSEFETSVNSRTNMNSGCPYCAGQKVNETNCLWTTHPEVARLLKDPQIGYKINAGSSKKEDFHCEECEFEQMRTVASVVNQGFSCICSDGFSYPEKVLINILNQLNLKYETQKTFKWSQNKRYDFYIPNNLIVETHGGQHYYERFQHFEHKTLEKEKENDLLKERLAKQNEIEYYIIIDCRKSEIKFIKNSIILSDLSKIYNLSDINWLQAHEFAINSLVKKVCDLKNEGNTIKEIEKILSVSRSTVYNYLRKGKVLHWCN